MRRLLLAPLLLTGCLNAHNKAYVAGSVANQITTQAHGVYDKAANARITECDPEANSDVTTKTEFDECLGPFVHNDKVVEALTIYKAAASALFAVLSAPESTDAQKESARREAIDAALDALALIPDAKKYVDQLREITR